MSKIICKADDKKDIMTNIISTMNYIQQNNEYNLIGWIKSTTIKPLNEFSEMFSDKITYQQLISILATTKACNGLIKFNNNTGEQKFIEDSPLYHANALDFFYAYYCTY